MATLRNKRELAAVRKETQEEHPRRGQSWKTSVPRINEEYITQVSDESRILGALSKLDEFLLNPQIRTHSGTVPGTFRNTNVENQGTNEDDSQSDPHPEAGIFRGQTTQNLGPKDCRDNHLCCRGYLTEKALMHLVAKLRSQTLLREQLKLGMWKIHCRNRCNKQHVHLWNFRILFSLKQGLQNVKFVSLCMKIGVLRK